MDRASTGRRMKVSGPGSTAYKSRYEAQPGKIFNLGKLQIAGILLIVVFVWCVISAVAIAMFEIHLLALTEFEDDGKADVSGFVTDEEGKSLVNVSVILHGTHHLNRTNKDGYYSIENVKEGDYEVEASLEDYGAVTKRVSLSANSPTLVNFVLEEGGPEKTLNERYGSNLSDLRHLNYATAISLVIYGSFALIGGILAYFQRFYWIAMFGALSGIVSGLLSIGIIVAPILSFIALIFIVNHKEEFITSETSFIDRLFGGRRVETRPSGVSKVGAKKVKAYGKPVMPKSKAVKTGYVERDYAPASALSTREMEPKPQVISAGVSKTSPTCILCGGAVKAESQGIVCQCGANYHRFCAVSVSICKRCGAPL